MTDTPDLLSRLRTPKSHWGHSLRILIGEAADAIERLQRDYAELLAQTTDTDVENRRLRAALEQLDDGSNVWYAVAARAALAAPEPATPGPTTTSEASHEASGGRELLSSEPVIGTWKDAPWFAVGDKVEPIHAFCGQFPICTITEITERGFKYEHAPIATGSPFWGEYRGGESYDPGSYVRALADPSIPPPGACPSPIGGKETEADCRAAGQCGCESGEPAESAHWEGCWNQHHACALEHISQLTREAITGQADRGLLALLIRRFMACRNEEGTRWRVSADRNGPDSLNKVYLAAKKYLKTTEHALTVPSMQWHPYTGASPTGVALFWVVPKTVEEAPTVEGNPIVATHEPYIHVGHDGTWSSLSKATHWMSLPAAP